jgi:polysaccharide export outer membrane protein
MKMIKRTHIFFLAMVVSGLAAGCGSYQRTLDYDDQAGPTEFQRLPEYSIQPGDQLDIKFFYNPELNETVLVRPDGKISLQLVDDVQAAFLTPAQLDRFLTDLYAKELKKPEITVIVRSFTGQRVYVGGEVNRQGIINLTAGMTALQAVFNAGGLKETADPESVLVIRKGADNRPIPIRVDLSEFEGESAAAGFNLQPDDIVYVPKTFIAEANKFVNQYVERLLLYRGISLGFTYELRDQQAPQ